MITVTTAQTEHMSLDEFTRAIGSAKPRKVLVNATGNVGRDTSTPRPSSASSATWSSITTKKAAAIQCSGASPARK